MSTEKEMTYLAYMLRLWRVDGESQPVWRASLESPHTGERQTFPDAQSLHRFLEETMGAPILPEEPGSVSDDD